MKELFIQQMDEQVSNMSDAEYQDWLNSQEPATQEQKESEHDAWWSSLTEEQKQQLFQEQAEADVEFNHCNTDYLNHWIKKDDNASR